MTEYQLVSNFNLFLISNAMFQLGVFILLWAALRGSLRIYDQGANIATKIISSLFGLGIVYNGLMVSGFFTSPYDHERTMSGEARPMRIASNSSVLFCCFRNLSKSFTLALLSELILRTDSLVPTFYSAVTDAAALTAASNWLNFLPTRC